MKNDRSLPKFTEDIPERGSVWELVLFVVFFVLIFSTIARADQLPSEAVVTSTMKMEAPSKPYVFKNDLIVSTATSIDPDRERSYSGLYRLLGGITHKASSMRFFWDLRYSREYSYESDDGTDGQFENPAFGIDRTFETTSFFDSVSMRLGGSLPANRTAQKSTLRGSLGPSVRVTKKFGQVSFGQRVGYSYAFFEYDIRDNGTVNDPNRFTSTSDLTFAITPKFSFSAALIYAYGISFQGVGKGAEASQFALGYDIFEKLNASIGISTERGTLSPDGQSDRVKFFDQEATTAFFDLSLSI